MKKLIAAALVAAGFTSSAQAATSFDFSLTPVSPINYAFDDLLGNADLTISGGVIQPVSISGIALAPQGSSGSFWSIDPSTSSGLISFSKDIASLSFLWGSPDSYNAFSYTTNLGTYSVTPFASGGNNGDTRFLTLTAGEGEVIKSLSFGTTGYAFEVDSLRYIAAVPEPGTWAMMALGFAGIGGALRSQRRRRSPKVAFA